MSETFVDLCKVLALFLLQTLLFTRDVLAITILSVCLSVCLSATRVD